MPGFMVVLRDSLSGLDSGSPDHGIQVGIVVRFAAEHLNSERSLFQMARISIEGSPDHIAQQVRITFAVLEQRADEDSVQLLANGVPLSLGLRHPHTIHRMIGTTWWTRRVPSPPVVGRLYHRWRVEVKQRGNRKITRFYPGVVDPTTGR